ncbi:unnamed protein product [Gongylonema pulchrum]|uniref:Uncharacterized protein n=1 Tax=Gongylonema pulchrum TaxID=637853 RepID=A0A3P7MPK3_9BILA|nr:unnamed protein product [Gongylonema pulchrum]
MAAESEVHISTLIRELMGLPIVQTLNDFELNFGKQKQSELPLTSISDSREIDEKSVKKLSLEEYKKRKGTTISAKGGSCSRTNASSSFIPAKNVDSTDINQASVHPSAFPTLSIDKLRRRSYRERVPTSNTAASKSTEQPNVTQTSSRQTSTNELHLTTSASSPPALPVEVINCESRLPLEDPLRLTLGSEERSSGGDTTVAVSPAAQSVPSTTTDQSANLQENSGIFSVFFGTSVYVIVACFAQIRCLGGSEMLA